MMIVLSIIGWSPRNIDTGGISVVNDGLERQTKHGSKIKKERVFPCSFTFSDFQCHMHRI